MVAAKHQEEDKANIEVKVDKSADSLLEPKKEEN